MSKKFHERFDIECSLEEAIQKFINRAFNDIFDYLRINEGFSKYDGTILPAAATAVGVRYYAKITKVAKIVNNSFLNCLTALEAVNRASGNMLVSEKIKRLLEMSEVDLGVKWVDGQFLRKGAEFKKTLEFEE